jgi:hypothetical protein
MEVTACNQDPRQCVTVCNTENSSRETVTVISGSNRRRVHPPRGMTGRLCANYGNLCRVFEWHGWATIAASPGTEDDEAAEARQRDAADWSRELSRARLIAGAAGAADETPDLRPANGRVHVWLAGSHNHRDETVIGLSRSIARSAHGSYGAMYVLDSDVSCTRERMVMRRGTVSREADTSLSPHIGVNGQVAHGHGQPELPRTRLAPEVTTSSHRMSGRPLPVGHAYEHRSPASAWSGIAADGTRLPIR